MRELTEQNQKLLEELEQYKQVRIDDVQLIYECRLLGRE